MKKFLVCLLSAISCGAAVLGFTGCDDNLYVATNAYFAPFEYYSGTEIVGVDVDIMNKVGEKLGKKVVFKDMDFDVIIDGVSAGKKYDCGAAGLTVTEERKASVDFSTPYFTSLQYVIFKSGEFTSAGKSTDGKNSDYMLWSSLSGKKIGVQRDTTGNIYAESEMTSPQGALAGTNASEYLIPYENAQLAVDAITASKVDVVIVDKLPAEYIVNKNTGFECLALYYDSATATQEDYAICVTKGNSELLSAINAVLSELGEAGINALVSAHLGLN